MDKNWTVTYRGFDKKEHPLQEALCTLGNGYFASRGNLEMFKNDHKKIVFKESVTKRWNYPGTYLAGGYNRMESKVQYRIIENEDLVNWPNWTFLSFKIEQEEWVDFDQWEILEYTTLLKLKDGILERRMLLIDPQKRKTELISRKLVSMQNLHLASIQWELKPVNWSGKITLRAAIDGNIINNNVERYSELNQDHLSILSKGHYDDNMIYMVSESKQSQIRMAQVCKTRFFSDNQEINTKQHIAEEYGLIVGDFQMHAEENKTLTVEKTCALYTSRDMAISDPLNEAKKQAERIPRFAKILWDHSATWHQKWQYNDIELQSSDDLDQLVLRLHIFHLYQTVSHNSIDYDIGIPARGWHGEAYRGHIFWDELYMMPFLNLHTPQLSKSLLMYRYRRIEEARHASKKEGFRGAMFPWQSGSNGREETQKMHLNPQSGNWLPDVSHLQYHINVAIPFNVWHYYQSTGDMDFLLSHGAEIILSSALFWSGIAHYNPERKKYEIHKVMGPDEYHTRYPDAEEPGLNNNAYTNVMAVWVIERALDLLKLLDEDCCHDLEEIAGYNEEDIQRWKEITENMFIPMQGKLIMQFEGYEQLKELDWDHYHEKYGYNLRLDRILEAEGDSCNYYKASKQADVLMLFYLFSRDELTSLFNKCGYNFDGDTIIENVEYYRKRVAHGSTLSQVIHSWVYARSRRDESWKRFRKALMSDYADVQGGTTHEGIHLGAMAGTLDIIQRCYPGLEIREDTLWFNPHLPSDVSSISFHVRYRGHWIKLYIDHQKIRIHFDKGWSNPVTIGVKGEKFRFETNDKKEFKL